jgi:hypothetical protein
MYLQYLNYEPLTQTKHYVCQFQHKISQFCLNGRSTRNSESVTTYWSDVLTD